MAARFILYPRFSNWTLPRPPRIDIFTTWYSTSDKSVESNQQGFLWNIPGCLYDGGVFTPLHCGLHTNTNKNNSCKWLTGEHHTNTFWPSNCSRALNISRGGIPYPINMISHHMTPQRALESTATVLYISVLVETAVLPTYPTLIKREVSLQP